MSVLGKLLIQLLADDSKFTFAGAEQKLTGFEKKVSATSVLLRSTLATALAGAALEGIKMAAGLETSFEKIRNLVGITGRDLETLKEGVKGISEITGRGQQELADALFVVTSAGLRGSQALDVLESSAKASAVGMGDMREIARTTTAIMQAYGDKVGSAARVTDVLTGIVREGNLAAEELAPSLGKVIGVAAKLGVSIEEVGANIATFTRLGVSSSEAATSLTATLSNFLKPSKEAKDMMSKLGISSDQLRASIAEKGLSQTLIDLVKLTDGNTEALGTLIPSVEALRGVLGTAGVQGKAYIDILSNIKKSTGLVEEGFKNVSETTEFKFNKSLESLKSQMVEFGSTVLPIVNKGLELFLTLQRKSVELNEKFKKIFGFDTPEKPAVSTTQPYQAGGRSFGAGLTKPAEIKLPDIPKLPKAEIDAIKSQLNELTKALADIDKQASVLTGFDALGEKINTLRSAIKNLISAGVDPMNQKYLEAIELLSIMEEKQQRTIDQKEADAEAYQKLQEAAGENLLKISEHLQGTFQEERATQIANTTAALEAFAAKATEALPQVVEDTRALEFTTGLFEAMGNAMMNAANQGTVSLKQMGKAALTAAADFVRAKLMEAIASTFAENAKLGPFGAILGAGLAAAAGVAFTALISRFNKPTPMAEGGMLYGPTNIIGGEYPGAMNNPEFVGKASDIVGYIQDALRGDDGGVNIDITGRLQADSTTLYVLLEAEHRRQKRMRGVTAFG